jgi:protein-tyrosine phosphatase
VIDLHCHLLPGIDDGAKSLAVSLDMARMAVAGGITVTACTPHILPGVYNNEGSTIEAVVEIMRKALERAGIPLRLVTGADVHVAPNLVAGLRSGRVLTINRSRYMLLEPPHHVVPPRLAEHVFDLHTAGYVAILTHPERLSWIENHYSVIYELAHNGVLMQLTAGSLAGRFGKRARYWAERLLCEGLCHLLASDAHDTDARPPALAEARDFAAERLGEEEATQLVVTRPQAILDNVNPSQLAEPIGVRQRPREAPSRWQRVLQRISGA